MPRWIITTAILAMLSFWASAQPPGNSALIPSERLRLFQRNQDYLEKLVSRAVELSAQSNPLERAKICRQSTIDASRELSDAIARDDADRVSEIGEYLCMLMSEALAPTLADARTTIPVGSPHWNDLRTLHATSATDAEKVELSIPYLGRVGSSRRVADLRVKLSLARGTLLQIMPAE